MEGTTLYAERGGHFSVGNVVGAGKDATVYGVHLKPDSVVKIWKPGELPLYAAFVIATIQALLKGVAGVAAVTDLVRLRPSGDVVGCIVRRVKGPTLADAKFKDLKHCVRAALHYAKTQQLLVRRTAFHYDQHPGNLILNEETGLLELIDCDGICFGEVEWPDGKKAERILRNGTLEWSPPEFRGKTAIVKCCEFAAAHITALVLWKIFMRHHPALCQDADGDELPLDHKERLSKCQWGRFVSLPDGVEAVDKGIVPYAELPDRIRWLFEQALSPRGLKDPENRPTIKEWVSALEEWQKRLDKAATWKRWGVYAGGVAASALCGVGAFLATSAPSQRAVQPAIQQKAPALPQKAPAPVNNHRPLLLEE